MSFNFNFLVFIFYVIIVPFLILRYPQRRSACAYGSQIFDSRYS